MKTANNEIKEMLELLSSTMRGLEKDIERLYEENLIADEPDDTIYQHRNQLRTVSIQIYQILTIMLDKDFSAEETRKLLKHTLTLDLIRDANNKHSPLGNFVKYIGDIG